MTSASLLVACDFVIPNGDEPDDAVILDRDPELAAEQPFVVSRLGKRQESLLADRQAQLEEPGSIVDRGDRFPVAALVRAS